jgi:hypothetical protein
MQTLTSLAILTHQCVMPSNIGPRAGGDQSWTISAGKVLRGALSSLIWTMIISGTRPCSSRTLFAARNDVDCAYGAMITDAHWEDII